MRAVHRLRRSFVESIVIFAAQHQSAPLAEAARSEFWLLVDLMQ